LINKHNKNMNERTRKMKIKRKVKNEKTAGKKEVKV
jgi:hypothetical protein